MFVYNPLVVARGFLSLLFTYYFFFFKQKAAYEMRISDWSSDVCSSDLELLAVADDVDAGGLLEADPGERRLLLSLDQFGPLQPPGRPELFRLRQPGRLRQAACHSRRNHGILPPSFVPPRGGLWKM